MFKTKFFLSTLIILICLLTTSLVKNKTRFLEKQIISINQKVLLKEKNVSESQLEFFYLSSPEQIEKRLNIIGFDKYSPITYSKIFFRYFRNKKFSK